MNAHHEPISFVLPATKAEHHWECVLDTFDQARAGGESRFSGGDHYELQGRSLVLLVTRIAEEAGQAVTTAQADQLRRDRQRTPAP